MTKTEVEALLKDFDEALMEAFPGPEPMSVLLVGGACLLLQGITTQPSDSVDVIIFEMLGGSERTLVFHSPTADKIRRIIREIGRRHGLKGERQQFFSDYSAPFLLELSEDELPPKRLLKAYRKLHLYAPRDLGYLLACKLMLGRPEKDDADLAVLCQTLAIQSGAQAHQHCQAMLALLCCMQHRSALIRLLVILEGIMHETDYLLAPIGFLRSPLTDRGAAPRQGREGAPDAWLDVDATVAEGLEGIEVGAELIVITWLHQAARDILKTHPRNDQTRPLTGVFATRSPDRPNPLGLHRVTVREIDGTSVKVGPIEAIDGTPVVDLKPVLPASADF